MATPPEATTTSTQDPGRQYGLIPGTNEFARLPIPGNAEFAVFLLVELLFAIIWAASEDFDAAGFVTATTVVAAAYLLSRGIAKASRVLEQ